MNKSLREASRIDWTVEQSAISTNMNIALGVGLRIADAVEKAAQSIKDLAAEMGKANQLWGRLWDVESKNRILRRDLNKLIREVKNGSGVSRKGSSKNGSKELQRGVGKSLRTKKAVRLSSKGKSSL